MAWYNKFDAINEANRQRQINDADRYGTPNGSHTSCGTVTRYRDGKPSSFWNSSSDTENSSRSSYFTNGFYNR